MVAIFTGLGLGTERGSNFLLGSRGQLGSAGFGRFGENVYVNAANGNLSIQRSDEILAGVGTDLALGRNYNSEGPATDENGDNWRLSASRSVVGLTGTVNTAGSTVTRIDWDGSDTLYTWDTSRNAYVCTQEGDAYDKLTFASGTNTWTWTQGTTGATETYAGASGGRITLSNDANGNRITFTYTGSLLTKVAMADGEYVSLSYTGNNLQQVATYAKASSGSPAATLLLTRVRYTYDARNRLSTVTTDLTPNDNSVTDGKSVTTSYTYDGTSTRVASISQTGGARLDISYVLVGSTYRVASFTQAQSGTSGSTTSFSYDVVNKITSVIDNMGQETRLTYDAQGHLTRLEQMPSTLGWTPQFDQWIQNPDGSFTRQSGGLAGSVLSAASYSHAEISAQITSATNAVAICLYDPVSGKAWDIYAYGSDSAGSGHIVLGNVYFPLGSGPGGATDITNIDTGVTFAPGDKLSLRWVNGSLHGFKGESDLGAVPNGPSANTPLKLLLQGFQNGATLQNVALSQSATPGVSPRVSTFTYNSNGTVNSATDPLGNATNYSYDANGNLTLKQDALGNATAWTYDSANHCLTETHYLAPDPDGSGPGTYSQPVTTRYAYDAKGNLAYIVTPEGRVTANYYNASGTLSRTVVFAPDLYDVRALNPGDAISLATLNSWVSAYGDKSSTHETAYTYDFRGNLYSATTYAATFPGGGGTGDFYATLYTYDQAGNLLTASNLEGTVSVLQYDGLGRVISRIDATTGEHDVVYDDVHNSQTETVVGGAVTVKVFDLAGELLTDTASGSGGDVTASQTGYAYDSLGRLRMQTDALGNKTHFLYDADGRKVADISADGAMTEYAYDADDHITRTISYATRLSAMQIASLLDAQGKPAVVDISAIRPATTTSDRDTWTIYDAAGRVIETIDPTGYATVYSYDGAARVVGTTRYYNALNVAALKASPPTSLTLPAANAKDISTRSFYDNDGHVVGNLDAAGTFTESSYDAAGQLICTTIHANLVSAGLKSSGTFAQIVANVGTSNLDRQTNYVYNNTGLLRYEIDAQRRVTEFGYDLEGNVYATSVFDTPIPVSDDYSIEYITQSLDSTNARITYDVYERGKKAATMDPSGQVTIYTYRNDVLVKTYTYATLYDIADNGFSPYDWLIDFTDPLPIAASADDRVSRVYTDSANRPVYAVDAAGYVTQTQYDADWRVASVTRYPVAVAVDDTTTTADLAAILNPADPGRSVSQYAYDADGRVDTLTDAVGAVTKYTYDAFDQVTDTIEAYGTAAASTTHRTYDQAGRVLSVTVGAGTAAAATIGYSYDAFGDVLTVTDPRNNVTTNAYDTLGRLISVTDPLGNLTSYQYDVFGNRVKTTDARGNSSYSYYDTLGRLALVIDAEGYATATVYNHFDEISSVTHYMTKVAAGYDVGSPPTVTVSTADETTSFTRDMLGRVTAVTDAEGASEHYTLDAFGNRVQVWNKLGGLTVNVFDHRGLLLSETRAIEQDAQGNVTKSVTTTYQYDLRGNRTQMTEAVGLAEQRTTLYKYDATGRLTDKIGEAFPVLNADGVTTSLIAPDEHYNYDLRGDLIEHKNAAGARTLYYYDAAGNKTAEINPLGQLTAYIHDKNGNLQSVTVYGDAVALPAIAGGTPPAPVNAANKREIDYEYDKNNHLLNTIVHNVDVGSMQNGQYFFGAVANLVSSTTYDAAGNAVVQTDGRGNQKFAFYDKNGHKIGEVDREKYLTTYDLDADGNVLRETRYATRLPGTVSQGSDVNLLKASISASADDRTTSFTYDRDGRRLTETRLGLVASSVNASSGAISTVTTDATIHYSYNGLGLVTQKVAANGDTTDYRFDLQGRMTEMRRAAYLDYQGNTVRPTTDMEYDGTDQLLRQLVRGTDGSTETDDRITTYQYDKGGHVIKMTDPTGPGTQSYYDRAGRLVLQQYSRQKSDGSTVVEGQFYTYDLAGHQVSQQKGQLVSGSWSYGPTTNMLYDVYGEMIGRGTNTGGSTDISKYQEFADYDAVGRVFRTNFGDGATKAYAYDANGNATMLLQSTGSVDLRSMTLAAMVANGSGATQTISTFDKRNQLIETVQPSIENAANLPNAINSLTSTTTGTNFTPTTPQVTAAVTSQTPGSSATNDGNTVSSNVNFAAGGAGGASWRLDRASPIDPYTDYYSGYIYVGSTAYGNGNIIIGDGFGTQYQNTPTIPATGGQYYIQAPTTHPMDLYFWQDNPTGTPNRILLGKLSIGWLDNSTSAVTFPNSVQLRLANPASQVFARASGGAWVPISLTAVTDNHGSTLPGWYSINPSQSPFNGMGANQTWDIKYLAMSGSTVIDSRTATLRTDSSGTPSITVQGPAPIGGTGKMMLVNDGSNKLVFTEQNSNTSSVRVSYRLNGSTGAFTVLGTASGAYGGFAINVNSLGGTSELLVEDLDGSGTVIKTMKGTYASGSQPSQLFTFTDPINNYTNATVAFANQPWNTATFSLWYKKTTASSWIPAGTTHNGANWTWTVDRAAGDDSSTYDFKYQALTSGGQLVDAAHGQMRFGPSATVLSNYADNDDAKVVFSPPQPTAYRVRLYYRYAGSTGSYSMADLYGAPNFTFDVDAANLRPGSGYSSYEFLYDVYDSSGHQLPSAGGEPHATGIFQVNSNRTTSVQQVNWYISIPPDAAVTIDRKQSYDAFGEIASETDGRGNTTNLSYNVEGKLILKQDPLVDSTDEHNVTTTIRPTTHYYYDLAGRLVGVEDSYHNINKLVLLAGSGEEDGEEAVTTKEIHADNGTRVYQTDIFGDVRTITDERLAVTLNSYDKDGRLTQVIHPTRVGGNSPGIFLTDNYTYDALGQRIGHTEVYGSHTQSEATDYDMLGRVTRTSDLAGNVTTYSYSWSNTLANAGTGTVGSWTKQTNTASGNYSLETDDYFGRIVGKTDLGGHVFTYGYNNGGQLISQTATSGENISYLYYGNGYVRSVTDLTLKLVSTFEYDKEGNRTRENYSTTDTGLARNDYQAALIQYDALNRIISFTDPKATITYKYDANSNRREVKSVYTDGLGNSGQTQDFWYAYDNMNRFTVTMGQLVNGTVDKGTTGVLIGYDQAGDRMFAVNGSDSTREDYTYTTDGYLEDTKINGTLRARRVNDELGRVTTYTEYASNGTTATYIQATSNYDGDNRVVDQTVTQSGTTTTIHNDYRANVGGTYVGADQGVLVHSRSTGSTTTDTVYTYQWWDQAKQQRIQISANGGGYVNAQGASQLAYDVNGHLTSATLTGGSAGTITYTNDAYGQVLLREQKDSSGLIGTRQLYYYFDGNRIGDVSNNGPSRVDYAEALKQRAEGPVAPGAFRQGHAVASADFDENYEPIGPNYPAQAASQYTVRSGDTLESIAQAVWGDSSMWYLIADANGLSASDTLSAGQILIIPNKVTNIHNRSGVYRVYDPGEAIGDALPVLPVQPAPPAHHHGCGIVGQVLLVAVAVAVSALTYGALTGPTTSLIGAIEAGAVAGAAGSVASQAVGLATGIQDKFSFKAVAMAAIGGGVGGALHGVDLLKGINGFAENFARGALSNGLQQGIGIATGLQHSFDWAGVAAGGVASGVLGAIPQVAGHGIDHYLAEGLSGSAAAVAGAATRSLLTGSDFGDNVMSALPDAVGNTIGNLVASGIASIEAPRTGGRSGSPQLAYTDMSNGDSVANAIASKPGERIGGTSTATSTAAGSDPASATAVDEVVITANRTLGLLINPVAMSEFNFENIFMPIERAKMADRDAYFDKTGTYYSLIDSEIQDAANIDFQGSFASLLTPTRQATAADIRIFAPGAHSIGFGVGGEIALGGGVHANLAYRYDLDTGAHGGTLDWGGGVGLAFSAGIGPFVSKDSFVAGAPTVTALSSSIGADVGPLSLDFSHIWQTQVNGVRIPTMDPNEKSFTFLGYDLLSGTGDAKLKVDGAINMRNREFGIEYSNPVSSLKSPRDSLVSVGGHVYLLNVNVHNVF